MIVYLLSSSPKNGVELMDGVETITRGWWRPTPGSIYPLLREMTDQGIVRKLEDGRYELTSKGRTQMEGPFGPLRRPQTMDDVLKQMQSSVSFIEDFKASNKGALVQYAGQLESLTKRLADLAKDDASKESSS